MTATIQPDVDLMPALPVHALSPIHSTFPDSTDDTQDRPDLNRSASFSYLSGPSRDGSSSIKRTFSDNVLSFPTTRSAKVNDNMQSANKELFRRASRKTKKKLSSSKFSFPPDEEENEKDGSRSNTDNGDVSRGLARSVTGTFRSLARRSWISPSRSSSPASHDQDGLEKKRSWSPAKNAAAAAAVDSIAVPKPVASRSPSPSSQRGQDDNYSKTRKSNHSDQTHSLSSASLKQKSSESSLKRLSRRSSFSSLRSRASSDRMRKDATDEKVPPLPSSLSSDRLNVLGAEFKKKDPLWTPFRAIEGEFTTFQAKTSMQKAKVLRTSLLPFLAKYADHPSNKSMRAEDLDRRVVILNKWWTGLLEMLNGSNNQAITGTDRPAFLEATSQIMMRPEWRIPPFPSNSGDTPQPPSIKVEHSSTSLKSDESDFLVESVYQNVRTMFVQNLLSQMAFVVEKLSMRSAPASLVTFGGKACAYAFFYCPGIADMLARLWRISPGTLRRIFSECGIERGDKLDLVSKALSSQFPAPARSLVVGSLSSLTRSLQLSRQVPPGTEHILWHGPWIGRWSGRDSDLFFVFTKWYHILVADLLQDEVSTRDRVCIPGFVPIHAQILTILETTVYRQAGQQSVDNYASGTTNGIENPDTVAPLPMTIANVSRQIAENRLVILLRDVLGDRDPSRTKMQDLYMSSFGDDVKAATRKISLYNNDACFVLCDFMEEIFPIMARHHQDTPFLDWPFWLKVCKQMMQSHNTLTQVRLIAFVYSSWSFLISNEVWKRELVLEWLLEREFFDQHFNHWSPMVRHYFFRLLCWRIGRCDGDPTALDISILETLLARLNRCWAHYQYLTAEAEMRDLCPPSTMPCSPAPNRSLVIIRTDSQPLPPGAFSSFDKFFSPGLLNQSSPYQKHSSVLNSVPPADSPTTNNNNKKRWSLLKSMLPFGATPGNHRPGEVTPPRSPPVEGGPQLGHPEEQPTTVDPISRPATPPHQAFSFRFSLEWAENRNNLTNRNRRLVAPLLPTNAQRIVDLRKLNQGDDNTSRPSSGESQPTQTTKHATATKKRGEIKPRKPVGKELDTARYSGRALAEWAQILQECRNFYLRRKQEGVPRDGLVETPVLGIETFRMIG